MLYTSIVAERIGLRRSFAVIMAMSFALNFILALALLLQQPETRTIVVPPTLAAEREVWMLFISGLTAPQIAAQLGVGKKSVENTLYRARKKLRESFSEA